MPGLVASVLTLSESTCMTSGTAMAVALSRGRIAAPRLRETIVIIMSWRRIVIVGWCFDDEGVVCR
jgi:hypothetical protein